MKIIALGRAKGKTIELIKMSAETKIPIICMDSTYIKNQSRILKLSIPDPIEVRELISKIQKYDFSTLKQVYVDDAEFVLEKLLNLDVKAITITTDETPLDCKSILINILDTLATSYKSMIRQDKYNEAFNILKNIELVKRIIKED